MATFIFMTVPPFVSQFVTFYYLKLTHLNLFFAATSTSYSNLFLLFTRAALWRRNLSAFNYKRLTFDCKEKKIKKIFKYTQIDSAKIKSQTRTKISLKSHFLIQFDAPWLFFFLFFTWNWISLTSLLWPVSLSLSFVMRRRRLKLCPLPIILYSHINRILMCQLKNI